MVVDVTAKDLVLTDAITGVPAWFMRPSLESAGYDIKNLRPKKIDFDDAGAESKAWRDVWSAGQGVGVITKKNTVKEIVEELRTEYEMVLKNERMGDAWASIQ